MAKKKSSASPTQHTMKLLRRNGWVPWIVEKRNPITHTLNDFFNCIDIIACNGQQTIGIQTTSNSNKSARLTKIKMEPMALIWINSGNRLFVHGWEKNEKINRWKCRELEITPEVYSGLVEPEWSLL